MLTPIVILVLVCIGGGAVSAQRNKDGCFDRYKMSCETTPDKIDASVNAEEICTKLSLDVFPSQDALQNVSLHPEFLNGIGADSDLCKQIQKAYHQCSFCLDPSGWSVCFNEAAWTKCGDKPTEAELLSQDNYPMFQTVDDIQQACDQLGAAYALPEFLKNNRIGLPSTIELCEKQTQAKHLCGPCDGGCFNGQGGVAPTCTKNPNVKNESFALPGEYCWVMDYFMLSFWMPLDKVLNISNHQDYLREIPGNSSHCDEAQLAYADCYWCTEDDDRCFSAENPPSCTAPDELDETIDFNSTCKFIFSSLDRDLGDGSQAYYNLSLHTDSLLFKANNTFCDNAKQTYHKCMWCHQTEYEPGFCTIGSWCRSEATIPDDYVLPPWWSKLNLTSPDGLDNCNQVFDFWKEHWFDPYELDECYRDIWVHRQCQERFCHFVPEEISKDYLGASTLTQKRSLVWMSRVAALLSFGGACFVIRSIFANVKRQKSVYYHLLFGMAIFDIITAVAWVFATAPISKEIDHIYEASGTEATCKAQAFFVQLGFTSIFYNVSLAFYYVMVVAYNRKEFQLRAIQYYLHGFPLLIGLGLALGAIPTYHWIDYGCHILPYSAKYNEGELWSVLVFVVLPLGFSIVSITAAMLVVYWKVSRQTSRAKKWQLGKGSINQLESQVFWQCLFYVLAFYITWPILFSVYLASVDVDGPLGLTLTVAFVAPLQGFNNFLVFVRPKAVKLVRERWAMLQRMRDPSSGTQSSNTDRAPQNPVASVNHDSTTHRSEAEDHQQEPVIEGLNELSTRESCVVHFPDGTSQALEDVHDMDPSALLPLTKDSTREADGPQRNSIPKFASIREEVVAMPVRSPPIFHLRKESFA